MAAKISKQIDGTDRSEDTIINGLKARDAQLSERRLDGWRQCQGYEHASQEVLLKKVKAPKHVSINAAFG